MELLNSEYFPLGSLRHLNDFRSISLEEMDGVKLMTRTDAKYLCEMNQLDQLLQVARHNFRVLEIQKNRIQGYQSTYLDTPDHRMYLDHHNGKLNRYKIRIRKYQVSGQFFLEIKKKNNKRTTIKKRMPMMAGQGLLTNDCKQFIADHSPFSPEALVPVIQSSFNRITLVNNNMQERVTIDVLPTWQTGNQTITLPNLVIIEVKSSHTSSCSGFGFILREQRIHPARLSKYCTGTALLFPEIKQNRFKEKLLYIKKLDKSLIYNESFNKPA